MFYSFDEEALPAKGMNWTDETSLMAMSFALLGHQIRHLKIIEENCYPAPGGN